MRAILTAGAALAALAASPGNARQAPAAAATAAPVDGVKTAEAVRAAVRENYVVAETRPAIDAALAKGIASGRYAGLDPQELARRISDDLLAAAHDKHLNLRFDPATAPQLGARLSDETQEDAYFRALARKRNHGVVELRVLDGNVRMMRYDGFMWTGPESGAAIDAAMRFLKGGDAAIIDISHNGGGSPEAVAHLAGYFLPAKTKLVTFYMGSEPPTDSLSDAIPAQDQLTAIPVYVLISSHTGSAAEEFASHVAAFGFAQLVGETTAGAAYRNDLFPIPGGFVLSVSVGRPELAKGGNWEAKGVAPAIRVPVDAALERAQQAALTVRAAGAAAGERAELEWYAAVHAARVTPVAPARPLASYAGRFGPRTVTLDGDRLRYQRDGGSQTLLTPLAPDLFALDADPNGRVRFVVENGAVTGLELQRLDGSKSLSPKG